MWDAVLLHVSPYSCIASTPPPPPPSFLHHCTIGTVPVCRSKASGVRTCQPGSRGSALEARHGASA